MVGLLLRLHLYILTQLLDTPYHSGMLVHAKKGILTCDVDYDPAQGLDVLASQIISSFPYDIDGESIQFIDFAGQTFATHSTLLS